jgi:gamma-glutamyl hercynylcysteine S-oxide synthase
MSTGADLTTPVTRDALLAWFHRNRARSRQLFDMLDPAAYYTRPISLRNPIVFYEGHIPAFSVITLITRGLGRPGVDERLERLFARGIDPESEDAANPRVNPAAWPTRDEVLEYARRADALIEDALRDGPIDQPGHPLLDRAEAAFAILEHEAMHQETLLYMWHRLPLELKRKPIEVAPLVIGGAPPGPRRVTVRAGRAMLGAVRERVAFGWDNEFPAMTVDVPAFDMDVYNVTNEDYLRFVEAGGYDTESLWDADGWSWRQAHRVTHPLFWERHGEGGGAAWFWRGQFDLVPLPAAWPVYVSHAEASAYARWQGARLPTEAEYHRAAFGAPNGGVPSGSQPSAQKTRAGDSGATQVDGVGERTYPWGEAAPEGVRGNFDFGQFDPVPVGSHPDGASAWGVEDLAGNGWEWTSTVFDGFPGFKAMPSYPEYSADFFDNQHYVMKGASPVTAAELIRRGFRNWFRPNYPYVYATFRLVYPARVQRIYPVHGGRA